MAIMIISLTLCLQRPFTRGSSADVISSNFSISPKNNILMRLPWETRKCREKLFGVCSNAANAKMGKSVLAEVLQTPKWRKESLRDFRKRQNGENGSCGTSANIKMEKNALAGLPQASKWRKEPLREFRKHQNGENGSCGTSASVKTEKRALAELPQTSKRRKRPLRDFRKRQNTT